MNKDGVGERSTREAGLSGRPASPEDVGTTTRERSVMGAAAAAGAAGDGAGAVTVANRGAACSSSFCEIQ